MIGLWTLLLLLCYCKTFCPCPCWLYALIREVYETGKPHLEGYVTLYNQIMFRRWHLWWMQSIQFEACFGLHFIFKHKNELPFSSHSPQNLRNVRSVKRSLTVHMSMLLYDYKIYLRNRMCNMCLIIYENLWLMKSE